MKQIIACLTFALGVIVCFANFNLHNEHCIYNSDIKSWKVEDELFPGNLKSMDETLWEVTNNNETIVKFNAHSDKYYFHPKERIFEKNSYNDRGTFISKKTYLFDKSGYLIEFNDYDHSGNLHFKWHCIYDEHGSIKERSIITSEESDTLHVAVTYFEEGKKYFYSGYFFNRNEDSEIPAGFEDIYNKDNKISEKIVYSPLGALLSREKFIYDENGNLQIHFFYDSSGSLVCYLKYKYDSYGNEVEIIRYVSGYGVHYTITYKYIYDFYNNWRKKLEFVDGRLQEITERQIEYYY